jgi:hypothetical protein
MLYAILCYDDERTVAAWSPERDAAVVARLRVVEAELRKAGRLGPVARLRPTTTAKTVRKGGEATVLDGPFAETKEQLLGFFVVACESLEEAVATARDLARASGSAGAYEVRPIALLQPGELGT